MSKITEFQSIPIINDFLEMIGVRLAGFFIFGLRSFPLGQKPNPKGHYLVTPSIGVLSFNPWIWNEKIFLKFLTKKQEKNHIFWLKNVKIFSCGSAQTPAIYFHFNVLPISENFAKKFSTSKYHPLFDEKKYLSKSWSISRRTTPTRLYLWKASSASLALLTGATDDGERWIFRFALWLYSNIWSNTFLCKIKN